MYGTMVRLDGMRKTTLRIDEHLLAEAKRFALDSGKTLTQVVEESIRERLNRRSPDAARSPFLSPTDGDGGLRAGVDLDDSASLADLMDGR